MPLHAHTGLCRYHFTTSLYYTNHVPIHLYHVDSSPFIPQLTLLALCHSLTHTHTLSLIRSLILSLILSLTGLRYFSVCGHDDHRRESSTGPCRPFGHKQRRAFPVSLRNFIFIEQTYIHVTKFGGFCIRTLI